LDKGVIWGVKLRSWGVIVSLTLVVAGCGRSAAKATLPPTPIPRPTPTPTVSLAFQVGVTDVPLKKHRPKAKPSPLPSPPPGPYIRIFPNAGSPVPHTVHVYGAHLPHDAALQLVWSSQNVLSSVTAPAHTDTRGRLQAVFHVPAASPGPYRVVAEFGGSPLTSAPFTVRSSATLAVDVEPAQRALRLAILGRQFVPKIRLTLILYSLAGKSKGAVLANVHASAGGTFSVRLPRIHLSPGEYLLRAYPSGATAQTAETVFQVVV